MSGGAGVVALAVLEYGPVLGTASCARTRYEYGVEPVSPVSERLVEGVVPISEKFEQPAPWQRSTR